MILRLQLLLGSLALGGVMAAGQGGHGFGPVPPAELPDIAVTRHDGAQLRLRDVFRGHRTAVQFIFVDCPTACPLLGSLFRKVDQALGGGDAQLVSITVNPERDSAARMAEWRKSFSASPRWFGLRVEAANLPAVLAAFGEQSGPPTGHTLQVFLVDGLARYVARTTALPSAAAVASALRVETKLADSVPANGQAATTGQELFEGRSGVAASVGADRLDPRAAQCSGCHGARGNGGGEGKTVVPGLRGDALTKSMPRRGGPASAYSRETFCASLRSGVDPAGVQFSPLMPRYQIDNRSCAMLWQFLTSGQ
jgi:cytochrome oxidase Cu insertion factor (SCO1/SenC/PrrC family)